MKARALWLLRRLQAMEPAEIGHRVIERAKRWRSKRVRHDFSKAAAAFADGPPALPGFADGVDRLARDHPAILEDWRAAARAKEAGWRFFGLDWPKDWRWSSDPVTGGHWPHEQYCFDIDYRHGGTLGDVKYVWELNRLQLLAPAAALARVERDADLAEWCAAIVEDWIDANPPYQGVAWGSGIEIALRVTAILAVLSLLPERFAGARGAKLGPMLAASGHWLARYPSRHSSANNHLVAEGAGLFFLGVCCPTLEGARAWAEEGRATLEREALLQVLEDGVGAEQAPSYQALSMDWFGLAHAIGARLGKPFSTAYCERMAAGAGFLDAIMDAGGAAPSIGDDDACRALAGGMGPENVVLDVAAFWRGLAFAPAHRAARPHLRWALLDRSPEKAPPPPAGLRRFDKGGYAIVRAGAGADERLAVFDHGPLGYLSIAAHGHADALSLWLHLAGRPVLVDPGTYAYHGAGGATGEADDRDWRAHFRATRVHPTLALEDGDQSEMTGPFMWGRKAKSWLVVVEESEGSCRLVGRTDGWRAAHGVEHERRVAIDREGLVVEDRLVGGARRARLGWLAAPDLRIETGDAGLRLRDPAGRALLEIASDKGLEVGTPESGDRLAWFSPTFGALEPATRIALEAEVAEDAPLVTRMRFFPS